ncbi:MULTISPECIES: phosphogluconate dehydrogenase (NAD(+)-dependent, decarboxylating) [unclassified Solibacillus]|uniref:phosphogluconate dehydrogenase (NAD(+)-dependent, decarboxylating) n=1 Tax=unclassified Solibacillus TaxID=2637870 RepID=UPI0030F88932
MRVVIYGFGKMGRNIALNILEKGYSVIGYDIDRSIKESINKEELFHSKSFIFIDEDEKIFQEIKPDDLIFLLVPPGKITDEVLTVLLERLPEGSTLIEGGNSNFKEAMEWAALFKQKGIHFLDMGTSGGINGARNGLCAMIGGDASVFEKINPFLKEICCKDGLIYTGASGSGHYLKMIHNGIEYGMMQAIAEGFEMLEKSEFDFNYSEVAKNWNSGSVIRSWLMDLLIDAFQENNKLDNISGKMHASGEVKWLMEESIRLQLPVPVTYLSLMMRNRSLEDETFSGKVVSALRYSFGGHNVSKG